MGVGGMVSGGIYAVLGVAMAQAGNAVPISYLIAGVITLLTAYSYLKLTLHFGEHGGVFSFGSTAHPHGRHRGRDRIDVRYGVN